MKPINPEFQAAVVGVHILKVDRLGADSFTRADIHGLMEQTVLRRELGVDGRAIGAEHGVLVDGWSEEGFHRGCIERRHDVVRSLSTAVPSHENAYLLLGAPSLGCLAAALPGFASQIAGTLRGLQEEGFIGFHDTMQGHGLVLPDPGQEPMPPAEGGVPVDSADLGGCTDGKAVLEAPGEVVPLVLLAEPSQWSARQGVESLGAVPATEPLQAVDHTPFADPDAATVRTLWTITKPILDCLDGLQGFILGSSQRVQQGGALLRGQRSKVAQESLEVPGSHGSSSARNLSESKKTSPSSWMMGKVFSDPI